jgi:regulatory protein
MSEESKTKAVSVAAAVLNYKNRSSRMLYEKLLEKGIEPDDAEYAIERLRGFGYLNDLEYASSAVRYGISKGWGKMRIRRKLSEYKLDEEIIEQALSDYVTDEDKLDRFIMQNVTDLSDRKEKKRITDKLARRGYSWEEIGEAMRRCSMEYEEY